jgi:polar amino acid transport system substrate-binding protein
MGDEMKNPKIQIPNPKLSITTLVVIVLGIGIWGLGNSRWREDAAWKRIRERGYIVVATDASYLPFSAVDENGSLFGFDVDLADEIGRRLGVRVEYENITYDALLAAVISGRDDAVVSAFVAQPERLKEVTFTRPYFASGTVAVIRAEGGHRLEETDPVAWSAGKTVAVEYGSGGDALARGWARRAAGVTILAQLTPREALQLVEQGGADAAVVDAISAYDFLKAHPALTMAGPPLEPEPYVIAVNAQSHELFRALETALAEMETDGTLAQLKVKWFGEAARE